MQDFVVIMPMVVAEWKMGGIQFPGAIVTVR